MQVCPFMTVVTIMIVKPIPINLLPSTVTYTEYIGKDRFNEPSYKEPINLQNVRIQKVEEKIIQGLSEKEQFTDLLFFDCTNSKPHSIKFKIDSLISYEGDNYLVKSFELFKTFNDNPHHYELKMISC